jgi:hypothetical protein
LIKADKGIFHLQQSFYLPAEGVKSVESIIIDNKFEKALFISRSTSELSQVTFDPETLNFFDLAQLPSQPSSTSLFPQNQDSQTVHIPVT